MDNPNPDPFFWGKRRARNSDIKTGRETVLETGSDNPGIAKSDLPDGSIKKGNALSPRLKQGHLAIRPKERKRNSRQSSTRTHVQYTGTRRTKSRKSETIGQMVANQLGKRASASQIDPHVPLEQPVKVSEYPINDLLYHGTRPLVRQGKDALPTFLEHSTTIRCSANSHMAHSPVSPHHHAAS